MKPMNSKRNICVLFFLYKSSGFIGFTRQLCGFIYGFIWFHWFHMPAVENPKDLEVVPHPEIPIHINNDMNINIHIDINMNIDIHIIINMNRNFGVGDHFQVLRVFDSRHVKPVKPDKTIYETAQLACETNETR